MMNWGVNVYENTNGNSYDTNIQFPREEYSNENIDNLLSKLIEFEKNIKNKAKENSKEWFGKTNMSDEVIDALWSPMLKYPKDTNGDPDYNRKPTIRIKLPMWENEPKFTLFNPKQEILVPNNEYIMVDNFIKKGSTIATIMMCGGIWFANGKFGVTWKLFQGVVQQVDDLQNNKCHINVSTYDSDGEDDIPNIEKLNIKRSKIPSVTHVDYSARIQTVHNKTNPLYYSLIKKFREITGCPVLINTSFNVRGEPIVCTPKDAFNCFMGTNMDNLIIGNFILNKEDQDQSLLSNYKDKYELD